LRLGVVVRATTEQVVSWAGVGITSNGGMKGADMMIAAQNATASPSVRDFWSAGYVTPTEDALGHVTVVASGATERSATPQGVQDAVLWFAASRPLSRSAGQCVGRSEDLDVTPGREMRLIYAFGMASATATATATAPMSYHGTSRGKITIQLSPLPDTAAVPNATLLDQQPGDVVVADSSDSQNLSIGLARGTTVPSAQSTYICRLVPLPATPRLVTDIGLIHSDERKPPITPHVAVWL